eukprot:1158082-Pelagomonas_calceolata.AAC.8
MQAHQKGRLKASEKAYSEDWSVLPLEYLQLKMLYSLYHDAHASYVPALEALCVKLHTRHARIVFKKEAPTSGCLCGQKVRPEGCARKEKKNYVGRGNSCYVN